MYVAAACWMLLCYASCPSTHCHPQHMVAGALAGMGEHLAMYPVDTIKTQMQALTQPGQQV